MGGVRRPRSAESDEGAGSLSDPGFSIHHALFDRTSIRRVASALERADLLRTRGGARHVLSVPEVRRLAHSSSLLEIAGSFLRSHPFPFRATLFDKSSRSNWLVAWHQDTALPVCREVAAPGWGPWSTKGGVLHAIAPASALARVVALRIHLDDCRSENGPLRVLPATHLTGVLTRGQIEHLAASIPAVECLTSVGGVVAMRPLVVHASSKARSAEPRRVLHIEFAATTDLGEGMELAVG